MNKILSILLLLISSRIILILGLFLLTGEESFSQFIEKFAWRWDGAHYITIAENGYASASQNNVPLIAFFPLYPLVIKLTSVFLNNPTVSAIVISNLFFVLGSFLFYKLYGTRAVFLLIFFPTSYFFSAAYPESLFLLLAVMIFYCLERNNLYLASLLTGLASLTRPFGLVFIVPLLYTWWTLNKKGLLTGFALLIPSIIAIAIYFWLNYGLYGNPFAFLEKIAAFPGWRQKLTFPLQSIEPSWQIAINSNRFCDKILVGWGEALPATALWLLIPFSFRLLRPIYFLQYFLMTIFVTSTGNLMSTPRHLLAVPPFFIIISRFLKSKILLMLWLTTSGILMISLAHIFTTGNCFAY